MRSDRNKCQHRAQIQQDFEETYTLHELSYLGTNALALLFRLCFASESEPSQ